MTKIDIKDTGSAIHISPNGDVDIELGAAISSKLNVYSAPEIWLSDAEALALYDALHLVYGRTAT